MNATYTTRIVKVNGDFETKKSETRPTLKEMQGWVGGLIQMVPIPHGYGKTMLVNEEGLPLGLTRNDIASDIAGQTIVGDAAVLINWNLE